MMFRLCKLIVTVAFLVLVKYSSCVEAEPKESSFLVQENNIEEFRLYHFKYFKFLYKSAIGQNFMHVCMAM